MAQLAHFVLGDEIVNICIVTVYDSINSGSFWQAYALGYVLKKLGHQVYYFQREKKGGASSSKCIQIKNLVKTTLKYGLRASFRYFQSLYEFNIAKKKFNIISNKKSEIDRMDCFVLGSDTIWNLDSKYFTKNYKIYWGLNFANKKTITYAGTVANTPKEVFYNNSELLVAVNLWDRIGVRDEYTREIISSMTKKAVEIVCDPTFLLTRQEYRKMINTHQHNKHIFLYLFEDISDEQSKELREFAQKNGLEIVQGINNRHNISRDREIVNSPNSFLQFFYSAEYIITDTFHGTAFSVNLQKQFVVIERSKNKVNDLLSRLEFVDRLAKENESLIPFLSESIDYGMRYAAVEKFRNDSLSFLRKAIGGTDNGD